MTVDFDGCIQEHLRPMNGRDERATNVLSRLFAYAPRPGRQALEDYCTEALAWCLLKSPCFLTSFLNLIGIPGVRDWKRSADVSTQVRFTADDLDPADEETSGGKFDMVIESDVAPPFVLVVESKVGSGFGREQIQNYREKLDAPDAFPGVPIGSRFLVTLTTIRHVSSLTDGAITWPQVCGAMADAPAAQDPLVAGLIDQFAAFLKEKGLSMLELKKTDSAMLALWSAIKNLEQQLMHIVERVRNQEEVKQIVGRRQVKPEEAEWIGVYGEDEFWAGFAVLDLGAGPELVMWVQITVPGDRRGWIKDFDDRAKAAFIKPRRWLELHQQGLALNCGNLTGGNSRFVFAQTVDGDLNGNGEAAFQSLYDMSKQAILLAERSRKRTR